MREQKSFGSTEEAIQFFVSHFEEKISDLELHVISQATMLKFLLPFVEANYPNCRKMLQDMVDNWHAAATAGDTSQYDLKKLEKIATEMRHILHVPDNEKPALQLILGGKDGDDSGVS